MKLCQLQVFVSEVVLLSVGQVVVVWFLKGRHGKGWCGVASHILYMCTWRCTVSPCAWQDSWNINCLALQLLTSPYGLLHCYTHQPCGFPCRRHTPCKVLSSVTIMTVLALICTVALWKELVDGGKLLLCWVYHCADNSFQNVGLPYEWQPKHPWWTILCQCSLVICRLVSMDSLLRMDKVNGILCDVPKY